MAFAFKRLPQPPSRPQPCIPAAAAAPPGRGTAAAAANFRTDAFFGPERKGRSEIKLAAEELGGKVVAILISLSEDWKSGQLSFC